MPYLILATAAVCLLLIGCSFGGTLEERQDRAEKLLNQATERVVEGIEDAKSLKDDITGSISATTEKIQETAEELKQKAEALQQGIEKVADAVQTGQEGIEAVRGALNVSGETQEDVE